MLLVSQLKIKLNIDFKDYKIVIAKKLQIYPTEIISYSFQKKSIDARKKDEIYFVYGLLVEVKDEEKVLNWNIANVSKYEENKFVFDYSKVFLDKTKRIAVIGFGPAGMFAALALSRAGIHVDVFERGQKVDSRIESIDNFNKTRELNTDSNIQFGEGGAGTFSDGKLTNRKKGTRGVWLFEELVKAGAPEEILYASNPHIGTDNLINVVKHIRKEIIQLGGSMFFNSKVTNLIQYNDGIQITVNDKTRNYDHVILAIGHSSRDTMEMLHKNDIDITSKPFAVGLRVEHNQIDINKSQFGGYYEHPRLGAAEYKVAHKTKDNRGVYSFCMCPGGWVVPSSSEEGLLVVNGMSEFARDRVNANSAIVVTVTEKDFESEHPLAGIEYQRNLERKAFELGGSDYTAPIQTVGDYLEDKSTTKLGKVLPSYPMGVKFSNLRPLFSDEINDALAEGLTQFKSKLKAFSFKDAVLTGIETRTSSPVRITRDSKTLQSTNTPNLYPTGEGAGYAGGITSAAIDGIKVAEQILEQLKK